MYVVMVLWHLSKINRHRDLFNKVKFIICFMLFIVLSELHIIGWMAIKFIGLNIIISFFY